MAILGFCSNQTTATCLLRGLNRIGADVYLIIAEYSMFCCLLFWSDNERGGGQ